MIRRSFLAMALALASLCALAGVASAEGPKEPAWKILAATGPTHLPPRQSEVQRVTVGAESGTEGTVTYSRKSAEGMGTPVVGEGFLTYTAGNPVATIESVVDDRPFEVGVRVTAAGFAAITDTRIAACSADCKTPGTTVTLSNAPTQSRANQKVVIYTKEIANVTDTFFVGDELQNPDFLDPGTVVTEVDGGTITTSKPTSFGYNALFGAISLTGTQTTAPIDFDASAGEVEAALEAGLPSLGPGGVSVSGGPGGDVEHPYFLAFGGDLAETDLEPLTATGSDLGDAGYVHVVTTVPGGPGTGEIVIFPVNVGGAATGGTITVELGPLPAGIVTAGLAAGDGEGSWSCTTGESSAQCTTTESVPALTPLGAIKVPIKAEHPLPWSSQVPVTISGGGAAQSASYQTPLVVSNQPASAGIAALLGGAFDANGEPATQAGGHPYSQVTAFQFNSRRALNGRILPSGDPKDIAVDLPAGFVGSPLITDRCVPGVPVPGGYGETPVCDESEKTKYTVGWLFPGSGNFGQVSTGPVSAPFYNDVPVAGSAAQFSTKIASPVATLAAGIRSEDDFGIRITSVNSTAYQNLYYINTVFYGEPAGAKGKAFFRNATDCAEQASSGPSIDVAASTWQQPNVFTGASAAQAPVTGCEKLSFNPSFSLQPTDTRGSSGVGATAHLHIDQSGLSDPAKLGTPDLQRSVVKLPAGLNVNPAQAAGLQACSESQVGFKGSGPLPNPTRFDNNPVSCPDGAKLGTVEASTPLLESPLQGTIYLAEPDKNPFGSLIALYLVIESPRFGITLKLPGKVDIADDGQLTATFDYVPQQPVEDLTLRFRGGGPRSEFATPEVCGRYSTEGSWTPWSAPQSGPPAQTANGFTVSENCAPSPGQRPFKPSFEAGAVDPLAASYSPLVIKVNRQDGEQELSSLDFTLPSGMTGKLAGVASCSEAAIETAKGKSGREEQSSSSCPAASQIGTVRASAGVGPEPFPVSGKAYLAGPYRGAPLSAVAISPAVAGPFDLGNVVVRAPLYIDETNAQITVKSDQIPTSLRGIPLKIRQIAIEVDRDQFSLNPSSCEAMAVKAQIGSSNGATAAPANRFQVGGCERLGFKPELSIRLKGATRRGGHPALTAILTPRPGDANIASLSVNMPHSEFLAQSHIRTICTRVQFAQGQGGGTECPKGSIYGQVRAWSPLLDYALEGPVILRSSSNPLPDLVAVVRGPASQPIVVAQAGRIDSKRGGIRNSFEAFPDVPLSKVVLKLPAGRKSLLENSTNICKGKHLAVVKSDAHNGRSHDFKLKVKATCKKKPKQKAKGAKNRQARRR